MWKEDLFQKKAWLESFNNKVNHQLDEFYSTVPDSDLTDREQYLYDMVQNQFKMMYELMDQTKAMLDGELMFVKNAAATRKSADTQI